MSYSFKQLPCTITTGNSLSTAVNVAGYQNAVLEVPTFSVGVTTATANVQVYGSQTPTGTFRPIRSLGVYSAGSGILEWETPSSNGHFTTEIPMWGQQWVKVFVSNETTATVNTKITGWNQ